MGRIKLAACAEASSAPWDQLTDTEKTLLIWMYPPAIWRTLADMEAESRGRPFGSLTGPEVAELQRIRASMRDTFDRLQGVGITVVGASDLLDD